MTGEKWQPWFAWYPVRLPDDLGEVTPDEMADLILSDLFRLGYMVLPIEIAPVGGDAA